MPNIFISYRRGDAGGLVPMLADKLIQEFGDRNVFMDVDAIPLGMDFRNVLELAVRRADVMLVAIGRNWLNAADSDGQRRLDDPNDFVRLEIEYAIKSGLPIVPAIVDRAGMLRPEDLPDSLRQLAYRQPIIVSGPSFESDYRRLVSALRGLAHLESKASTPAGIAVPSWKLTVLSAFAALLGVQSVLKAKAAGGADGQIVLPASPRLLESSRAPAEPEIPRGEAEEVFISYARDDAAIMRKVRERLGTNNISVWTDDKLQPGTPSWKKAVQDAIENSRCFIILLTPNAKNSDVVAMELGYALAHERIVLPVLAQGTNRTAVPLEIINRQWTDITASFESGMSRLVGAVVGYRSGMPFEVASA